MRKIINIELESSVRFLALVLSVHLLACCALLLSGLGWWIRIPLIIIILGHWYRIYRGSKRIRLVYDDKEGGRWLVKDQDNEWQLAELSPGTRCFRFYVLLVLKLKHSGRLVHLPLLPGDISPNDFRRLRVLLRFYD